MAYIDDQPTQRANAAYIRRAMEQDLLTREREQELARRWRNEHDEKALHELAEAYGRLVVAVASKFRAYGLPLGDLIQEGHVGLMIAAERFEPERDLRFATYATWWIRSTIQDYILRNWSIVRTGTTSAQKALFFKLRALRAKIESASGPEMTGQKMREKVARDLKVSLKDVEQMEQRLAGGDRSLNMPVGEDSEEEQIALLADNRPNPEEIVTGMKDAQTRSKWLNEALATLSERERRIVTDRHLKGDGVTLEDLGKKLGISKERVRQLEHKAMGHLKTALIRRAGDGAEMFG